MTLSIAARRGLLELASPVWFATRTGRRYFVVMVGLGLPAAFLFGSLGLFSLVVAILWVYLLPRLIGNRIWLRQNNRRLARRGWPTVPLRSDWLFAISTVMVAVGIVWDVVRAVG